MPRILTTSLNNSPGPHREVNGRRHRRRPPQQRPGIRRQRGRAIARLCVPHLRRRQQPQGQGRSMAVLQVQVRLELIKQITYQIIQMFFC